MKIDLRKFNNLSTSQWEEKIFYRAVNHKFPEQLKANIDVMYPQNLTGLMIDCWY